MTTVRDLMGVDVGVRDAVAHGLVEGPRLLVADKMLSQTGGHADFHIPAGISATEIIGGVLVDSVEQARLEARKLIREGVDVIKIASSGGVSSPNDQPTFLGFRTELVAAVVAKPRLGLKQILEESRRELVQALKAAARTRPQHSASPVRAAPAAALLRAVAADSAGDERDPRMLP